MKSNIFRPLILFVALALVSCGKNEDNTLFGYEFALIEQDGMVNKSSDYFREDTKENLAKDIYYEGGVYWAKGKAAEAELLAFFRSILESWHNEFGSADNIGFSISFLPLGDIATKSVFGDTKADNDIKLNEKDVSNFEREFKVAVNTSYDESSGISAEFKEHLTKVLNALNVFISNPTLDSYKSLKKTIEMVSVQGYVSASISDRPNTAMIRDVEILFTKLNNLFGKYDNIFIKA